VLKNYRKESEVLGGVTQLFFLSVHLSSSFQNGPRRMAEEPHQALEVLGSGGQEDLLPHKLQSPQTQATQPNLIFQFGEQRFYLLSLS